MNAAVMDIIESVVAITEFSEDDCDVLQKTFRTVIDSAPKLFELPPEQHAAQDEVDPNNPPGAYALQPQVGANPQVNLHEFVPNWLKFKELVLLLGSGLQTVCDRWASGKGPMALYFQPEEVKGLVVAMFDDTKLRASVLKQIR